MAEKTGIIYGINGPVIYMKDAVGFKMAEMVYVGKERLVGEVISITGNMTSVQVYEETGGLIPGETVIGTGAHTGAWDSERDLRRHRASARRDRETVRKVHRPRRLCEFSRH